jgi:hypothetical protein
MFKYRFQKIKPCDSDLDLYVSADYDTSSIAYEAGMFHLVTSTDRNFYSVQVVNLDGDHVSQSEILASVPEVEVHDEGDFAVLKYRYENALKINSELGNQVVELTKQVVFYKPFKSQAEEYAQNVFELQNEVKLLNEEINKLNAKTE